MRLKRPATRPKPLLLRVRLPGEVAERLTLYSEIYRESYGEEIRLETLAAEIVGQFLEQEPALRKKRGGRTGEPASSSETSSSHGERNEL